MTLSQVPRELAERLLPAPVNSLNCPSVEQVEAVIREAMQKALEHIEHGILCGRLGGLNTIVEEIRSLKKPPRPH
jgi:hypothetical protein